MKIEPETVVLVAQHAAEKAVDELDDRLDGITDEQYQEWGNLIQQAIEDALGKVAL